MLEKVDPLVAEKPKEAPFLLFQVHLVKNGRLFRRFLRVRVFAKDVKEAVEKVLRAKCHLLGYKIPESEGYKLDYAFELSPSINIPITGIVSCEKYTNWSF